MSEPLTDRALELAVAKALGYSVRQAPDGFWELVYPGERPSPIPHHTAERAWQAVPVRLGDGAWLAKMLEWAVGQGLEVAVLGSPDDVAPIWVARVTGPEWEERAVGASPAEALARALVAGAGEFE